MNKQALQTVLRFYITAVALAVVGYVFWLCRALVQTPMPGESDLSRIREFAIALHPYLLFVCFLVIPWWRMGAVIRTLGYAIAMPLCAYVVVAFLIVDIIYFRQKVLFQSVLMSGLVAQIVQALIPLAEELRNQDADLCKRHLRENHRNNLSLVEQFIVEVEGQDHDITVWSHAVDTRNKETLKRVDRIFESWLSKTKRSQRVPFGSTRSGMGG